MQAWQIYYIQTHKMDLWKTPYNYLYQIFAIYGFLSSVKEKSYYTMPYNCKHSKSVTFQKGLTQRLNWTLIIQSGLLATS